MKGRELYTHTFQPERKYFLNPKPIILRKASAVQTAKKKGAIQKIQMLKWDPIAYVGVRKPQNLMILFGAR